MIVLIKEGFMRYISQIIHTKTKALVSSMLATGIGLITAFSLPLSAYAAGSTVYDAVPSTLPPNVVSVGFEALSMSEFGDYIHLGGSNRLLNTVTVTMSDWALFSEYSSNPTYSANNSTWTHPITVNIYTNHLSANGVPDTKIATTTQNVSIPWRPVGDESCPVKYGVHQWKANDGECYNGIAFNATFDMSSLNVTLPSDIIVGVAYNTADYGAAPIHAAGPYNSLNVGVPEDQTVSVGRDDNAANVFFSSTYGGFYTDGGESGVGTFRQDTAWAPYGTMAVRITATQAMPSTKDQCMSNGWKSYGTTFKNQGDCVSYVATNGKNLPSTKF